jgi:ABC-type sugar transport system ATPase subunit
MSLYVEMQGITKDFPGTRALDGVDIQLYPGEIHALVGENGAGKSTLMKILAGEYVHYVGLVKVNGKQIKIGNPRLARTLGIAMIHQELNLVPRMSVAQNINLGKEPVTKSKFVDDKKQDEITREILSSLQISINPRSQVIQLSAAEKQIVEIAKAITSNPKILIMDEPTSSLTTNEVSILFGVLKELKKKGVAIIFITHKIEEVMEIADRVTVLRDGRVVSNAPIKDWTENKIINAMVGRELSDIFPQTKSTRGDVVLSVKNFTSKHNFYNIEFDLHRGEILGCYGLIGAGRTEIVEAIFGLGAITKGVVLINGKELKDVSVPKSIKSGIAFVPEDRRAKGLIPRMSVKANTTLANLPNYSKRFFVDTNLENKDVYSMVDKLKIKVANINESIEFLSGGNQQKVIIGKWLLTNPEVIIMDEPTRGIDVGSKAEIYKLIKAMVNEGKGVVLISSELPEILGMSDRILVFCEGYLTARLSRDEATEEKIMYYATNLKKHVNIQ